MVRRPQPPAPAFGQPGRHGRARWSSRQGKEFAKEHAPDEQKQAAGELFHGNREERTIEHDPNPSSTA